MLNEVRDTSGKFAPKSEVPRKVRSVNLTDDAWQWLAAVAEKARMSRNDYLEALAFGNPPLMETAKPQPLPFMEAVKAEKEVDGANIEKQPATELYPFIETVLPEVESVKLELENENLRQELEVLKQELTENTRYYTARLNEAGATLGTFKDKLEAAQAKNQRLQNDLGNSQAQVAELRSQLAAERAEREENKKSAPVEKDLPKTADLLNKLKAKRKKSKTDLADLEAILELLQG
jgi:DNA repair exonuclease SbcCD ATPase subunit